GLGGQPHGAQALSGCRRQGRHIRLGSRDRHSERARRDRRIAVFQHRAASRRVLLAASTALSSGPTFRRAVSGAVEYLMPGAWGSGLGARARRRARPALCSYSSNERTSGSNRSKSASCACALALAQAQPPSPEPIALSDRRLINDIPILTRRFRSVERFVGLSVHRLELDVRLAVDANTDRHARIHGARRAFARVHLAQDASRDLCRGIEIAAGGEDEKLIASQARTDVRFAHAGPHGIRDRAQEIVARRVSMTVVDRL